MIRKTTTTRRHTHTSESTRIGCLHERRSYSRVHTTPGSNVDTPIARDTTRSRMHGIRSFYLWAPKGISSSVVAHAPSPPGRMRLTSRQSISPWCATRRVFRHRSEQQATRRSSRRHRRSAVCAAVPHPSTKLPPRETARSDALTIEMSALEARPPTAPESWLSSGLSSPPWDRSFHDLAPNIPARRDQRGTLHRTPPGHRPPTRRTTPGPLTEQPTHRSRIGRFDTWFRRRQHTLVTVA